MVIVILPTQGDGDGVSPRIGRIAFEQIIGSHRDGDLLALIDFDYR